MLLCLLLVVVSWAVLGWLCQKLTRAGGGTSGVLCLVLTEFMISPGHLKHADVYSRLELCVVKSRKKHRHFSGSFTLVVQKVSHFFWTCAWSLILIIALLLRTNIVEFRRTGEENIDFRSFGGKGKKVQSVASIHQTINNTITSKQCQYQKKVSLFEWSVM